MLGEEKKEEEEEKKEEEKKEEKEEEKEGEKKEGEKEEEKKEENGVEGDKGMEEKDATFPLEEGEKKEKKKGGENVKLLAIDCEMCMTEDGLELTRLSAVNESLEVFIYLFIMHKKNKNTFHTNICLFPFHSPLLSPLLRSSMTH